MASIKKQEQATEVLNLLKEHNNFALIKFDKTPHIALEKLRRELKKSDAYIQVVKNAIFQKAVQGLKKDNKNIEEFEKKAFPLKESTALLSLKGDFVSGLSALHKFAQTEKSLSFKAGFIDNDAYDAAKLTVLAKLPPKTELLAKILGSLKSPSTRLVYSMKFNVSKLAYILNQRGKQSN